MKKFKNLSSRGRGGGVKNYFFEITVSCLFMLYLIIVFNNVSGYFSKTWT